MARQTKYFEDEVQLYGLISERLDRCAEKVKLRRRRHVPENGNGRIIPGNGIGKKGTSSCTR